MPNPTDGGAAGLTPALESLGEMLRNATQAPWLHNQTPKDNEGWATCQGVAGTGGKSGMIYAQPPGGTFPSFDKDLIITSRNILPHLLALVARQAEELEHWKRWINVPETPEPGPSLSDATDAAQAAFVEAWNARSPQ